MKNIDKHGECPECGSSWDGGDMPKESHKYYSPPYKWSRLIGIEDPRKYDGVSIWMCPDCKTQWDRFSGDKIDT
jgi:rubredoxin